MDPPPRAWKISWVLVLLLVSTLACLVVSQQHDGECKAPEAGTIPQPQQCEQLPRKLDLETVTVKILYSENAIKAKNNALQLSAFLVQMFPDLQGNIAVQTGIVPPSSSSMALEELWEYVIAICQLVAVASMVLGRDSFWNMVAGPDRPMPAFLRTMEQSKLRLGFLLFWVVPQLTAKLSFPNNNNNTDDALEIYLNEETLLFSQLKTGKLPNIDDIIHALVQAGLTKSKNANDIAIPLWGEDR